MKINQYAMIGWLFVSLLMWRGIYAGLKAVFG